MSKQLAEVKKIVPNCTFLAFEKVKDRLFFKAVIKDGKDVDRVRIEIKCPLSEVGLKEYDDLLNILINKSYDNKETI